MIMNNFTGVPMSPDEAAKEAIDWALSIVDSYVLGAHSGGSAQVNYKQWTPEERSEYTYWLNRYVQNAREAVVGRTR